MVKIQLVIRSSAAHATAEDVVIRVSIDSCPFAGIYLTRHGFSVTFN